MNRSDNISYSSNLEEYHLKENEICVFCEKRTRLVEKVHFVGTFQPPIEQKFSAILINTSLHNLRRT